MNICGLQKTTLLDFPGHVAATIFIGGCNFRCPFCHNSGILPVNSEPEYSEDEILSFLKKRKGILEGVCITGGEPALSSELELFIEKIKGLDLLVKLDTNGSRPQILKTLVRKGLIDYIAMDIKSGRPNYPLVSGVPCMDLKPIEESAHFLLSGTLPFEFRTTVVKELHSTTDFQDIGQWLQGCPNYYLQSYVDSEEVLCAGYHSYDKEELLSFMDILKPFMTNVSLRGIDY